MERDYRLEMQARAMADRPDSQAIKRGEEFRRKLIEGRQEPPGVTTDSGSVPGTENPDENLERYLTSDSTCDAILTELAVRAGGERGMTTPHMNLARWDLKAELRAAIERFKEEA